MTPGHMPGGRPHFTMRSYCHECDANEDRRLAATGVGMEVVGKSRWRRRVRLTLIVSPRKRRQITFHNRQRRQDFDDADGKPESI